MKITERDISYWLKLSDGDNITEPNSVVIIDDINVIATSSSLYLLKILFLEMKAQIDRWDLVTKYYVMHPSFDFFISNALDTRNNNIFDGLRIWGIDIVFSKYVPEDIIIGLADMPPLSTKEVVIGNMSLDLISRVNKLKAFW